MFGRTRRRRLNNNGRAGGVLIGPKRDTRRIVIGHAGTRLGYSFTVCVRRVSPILSKTARAKSERFLERIGRRSSEREYALRRDLKSPYTRGRHDVFFIFKHFRKVHDKQPYSDNRSQRPSDFSFRYDSVISIRTTTVSYCAHYNNTSRPSRNNNDYVATNHTNPVLNDRKSNRHTERTHTRREYTLPVRRRSAGLYF